MRQYKPAALRQRIDERALTVKKVAEFLDLDGRTIYRWCTGARTPRLTFVQTDALCSILGWSITKMAETCWPEDNV
jgi:predicted DNA-binding transcriptional regulator AlpA